MRSMTSTNQKASALTTDTTATKRGFHFKDITKMFGGGQSTLRQFGSSAASS